MSVNNRGVAAVIFDLSGTVIDHGSRGPVVAFVELFARHNVRITEEEARVPMGLEKRDHIRALLQSPGIKVRWESAKDRAVDSDTVDALYAEFIPLQIEVLARHCEVLPGVREMTAALRERAIPFCATTGFSSSMVAGMEPQVRAGGFDPDLFVCPDMVGGGRPAPWMALHAAQHMNAYPIANIVKVGDTPADIAEAQNAGMWSVAVLATGNELGLSAAQLDAVPDAERTARIDTARRRFQNLGAHYQIESAASLLPVIDDINSRLSKGHRP